MAVFFSNIPLTKETPQPTILELFVANDSAFSILDRTNEVYENKSKLIRDFEFVKKPFNEYQIHLIPPVKSDGLILGLFIAEGFDFEIQTQKEPIFKIEKNKLELSLKEFYDPNEKIKKATIGLFFPGTVIRYKINGIPYKDILTERGWTSKRETKSVSEVAKSSKNETLDELETKEAIKYAEELMKKGEISKDLFERYKIFRLGYDEGSKNGKILFNALTKDEVKLLKEKGL